MGVVDSSIHDMVDFYGICIGNIYHRWFRNGKFRLNMLAHEIPLKIFFSKHLEMYPSINNSPGSQVTGGLEIEKKIRVNPSFRRVQRFVGLNETPSRCMKTYEVSATNDLARILTEKNGPNPLLPKIRYNSPKKKQKKQLPCLAGKSPFLIGDTSSQLVVFFHVEIFRVSLALLIWSN